MSDSLRKLIRSVLVLSPAAYGIARDLKARLYELIRRPHDSDFRGIVALGISGEPLVLDIGANSGQAARSIFALVPGSKVVSFEPNPMHWESLTRLGQANVNHSFLGCALSDAESVMWLYWPVYNGCEFSPLASLDENVASAWLSPRTLHGFRSDRLVTKKVMVEVKTLDSFGFEPAFIKLDVEGASLGVLQGARETLRRSRPVLLIEEVAPGDRVDELLKGFDYVPYARNARTGRLERMSYGSSNTFFVPAERQPSSSN